MPIKRVFLLQTEMGNPDPWDDSLNLANVDVNPGLGLTNNAAEYQNNISFFQRADNRFSITNSVYTEYNLVLKRPFSIHDQSTEIPINFKQIVDILESHLWRGHTFSANVIMMASLLEKDKPLNQQDVISKATYYYRHGEKIIDIISGDEIKNPTLIPWFFCYKIIKSNACFFIKAYC